MSQTTFRALFWTIVAAALVFRVAEMGRRPVGRDEAQQAARLGLLLEDNRYRFDQGDRYGPSLVYLSLPLARVVDGRDFSVLREATLRFVPAVLGAGLILLLLLLVEGMGRRAVLFSAAGLALSPAFATTSRIYIPDILLVFFLTGFLASLWRAFCRPSAGWVLAAGLFAGLMVATSITSILALGATGGALLAARALTKRTAGAYDPGRKRPFLLWLLGILGALVISFVFYSSFMGNLRGWLDFFLSFKTHFVREGTPGWLPSLSFENLRLLVLSRCEEGVIWSEAFVLLLALAGGFAAFKAKKVFVLCYTLLSTLAYALLPSQEPCRLLPFYVGFILLAGEGASAILEKSRTFLLRAAVWTVLAAGFIHLGVQNVRANFQFIDHPCHPYTDAPTSKEIPLLALRVRQLSRLHPDGSQMPVQVTVEPRDREILSWYLRGFRRVDFVPEKDYLPDQSKSPLVILTAGQQAKDRARSPTGYHSEFFQLRPGTRLCLGVHPDLWQKFEQRRSRSPSVNPAKTAPQPPVRKPLRY